MSLEEKTGKDYVEEEIREALRKSIGKKTGDDVSMNIALYEALTTIVKCSAAEKKKDYELASAICSYFEYPVNAIGSRRFEEYFSKRRMSKKKSEYEVIRFLGLDCV